MHCIYIYIYVYSCYFIVEDHLIRCKSTINKEKIKQINISIRVIQSSVALPLKLLVKRILEVGTFS